MSRYTKAKYLERSEGEEELSKAVVLSGGPYREAVENAQLSPFICLASC